MGQCPRRKTTKMPTNIAKLSHFKCKYKLEIFSIKNMKHIELESHLKIKRTTMTQAQNSYISRVKNDDENCWNYRDNMDKGKRKNIFK